MIQREPQFDYEIDRGLTPRHPLDPYARAAYTVWALESLSTPIAPWDVLSPRKREIWREIADAVLIAAQMADKRPGAE